ncbi:hypothetical protein Poli38472_012215 [Pythium oligandrum]|uniref:Uncharacterized protein n=1 Tax=Pythium oligandrum TaxID=41045 RepID=A0A8K1CPZ0_PYTOL|nr:hypothetical protein Poli38472_012215 [Pythium oligandrum]|eukprot:TMW67099.1 hypothetical protein Poli38472_012215 [Pythium oligandrum]
MHPNAPPSSASRPLPKRSSTTAGFDDLDASFQTTHPPPPQSSHQPPPLRVSPSAPGASRKRHHSLPTNALVSDWHSTSRWAPPPRTLLIRRPEIHTLPPSSEAAPSSALSHATTTSMHVEQSYRTYTYTPARSTVVSTHATSLQPPEMSPREEFLVRAFVSDAMKLQHDQQPTGNQPESGRRVTPITPRPAKVAPPSQPTTTPSSAASSHQRWSREEDERLRDAVQRFGGKNWKMIAETLGRGRTDVQCLHRWNKVLKPGLVKGPWTPEEDQILTDLIARYGVGKIRWCDIALHLPGRIGKQCRERWCNHLDASIRKGQWTPEEDDTVFRLQQQLGNKWSEIAKMLPGRTENAVKNRFNSAARRKWLMAQAAKATASQRELPTLVTAPPPVTEMPSHETTTPTYRDSYAPIRPSTEPFLTYSYSGPPPSLPPPPPTSSAPSFASYFPYAPPAVPAASSYEPSVASSLLLRRSLSTSESAASTPVSFSAALTSLLSSPKDGDDPGHSSFTSDEHVEDDDEAFDNQHEALCEEDVRDFDDHAEDELSNHEGLRFHPLTSKKTRESLEPETTSPRPPDMMMDDQHMTTFLDSVALELDDDLIEIK